MKEVRTNTKTDFKKKIKIILKKIKEIPYFVRDNKTVAKSR